MLDIASKRYINVVEPKWKLGIFLMLDFNISITNHLSAAMFRKVCCWSLIPFWRLVRQDCGGVSAAEAASQLVRTILNSNLPDWHGFFYVATSNVRSLTSWMTADDL